jgi:hypothetical protein
MRNKMTKQLLTVDEIRDALKDRRISVVADATGLTYPTIKRLADGLDVDFSMKTIQKISDYILNDARTIIK